ncbi:hypothetical protein [Thermomonospora cellulosilytica]|uniref:Uncharacterized protein n=1 Tax=Thermomonospora cellulosilytica TaxID=1411118 RepID=A0A7W3N0T7_9ACTN|nr:hypothetical protein [Thermomonospora cellulosilytica]MBA9005451.1 hypothetical protein [Thermomonospora cellulosilytica]
MRRVVVLPPQGAVVVVVAAVQFGHLDDGTIYKIARGNAIRPLRLDLPE